MKKLLKKILPDSLLRMYKSYNTSRNSKFRNKKIDEVFTEIHNTNHWRSSESVSGSGSENLQTEFLIRELDVLFNKLSVTSILDIPCGDFNWMQRVNLRNIKYIGADIVEEIVLSNDLKFKKENILNFSVLNLISDQLPKSDVVFVRDCFVHLSYSDISNAINNIRLSGSKYLLTTTFTNHNLNHDIITGEWRPLNLQKKPFNFPEPLLTINEECTEGNGEYKDKSMSLWNLDDDFFLNKFYIK